MSIRTLRFGDRTISYDTGLNLAENDGQGGPPDELGRPSLQPLSLVSPSMPQPPDYPFQDDGIGTSDDESAKSETLSDKVTSGPGTDCHEDQILDSSSDQQPKSLPINFHKASAGKKVITLDMGQLLAFDEEEEDDYEDDSDDSEGSNGDPEGGRARGPRGVNSRALAKHLVANLTLPIQQSVNGATNGKEQQKSSSKKSNGNFPGAPRLVRRHSITLCQSRSSGARKNTPPSLAKGPSNYSQNSDLGSDKAAGNSDPWGSRKSSSGVESLDGGGGCDREDTVSGGSGSGQLKTLNLQLDEVAHIRSVLTKAQLETLQIDGGIRQDVERGRICFVCMSTRFGLFSLSRGQKCQMCKQTVCSKCCSKMRIPTEHFTATPVFALSPTQSDVDSRQSQEEQSSNRPAPIQFTSLTVSGLLQSGGLVGGGPTSLATPSSAINTHANHSSREKKTSLPANAFTAFSLQSVGSAPSSPTLPRKSGISESLAPSSPVDTVNLAQSNLHQKQAATGDTALSTISQSLQRDQDSHQVPKVTLRQKQASKYATLPRNNRLSWLGPSTSSSGGSSSISSDQTAAAAAASAARRDKIEGSLLVVCSECKDMVVQVIRVSRSNKRLQSTSSKSMLLSLSPERVLRETQRTQ